ncbi:LuxR C-terminal-related transcriptional regulator [Legionella norrlandica]|uniref:helix-turn-helix transcriptional regulator n=1 Tax=Legionella norrlandica TaxID=1498499 RepID=UPI0009DF1126
MLFLFIARLTAKAIGNKLSISAKTVEFYIACLKQKFNCTKKYQLIEKGFDLGLLSILPSPVLKFFDNIVELPK